MIEIMRSASVAPNTYMPQIQDHRHQQMMINHPATAAALLRQPPPPPPSPPPPPPQSASALSPPQAAASAPARKPILYYSNHCQNSRLVIETLLKHDLRALFACVCVDKRRELVPHFVKTVPTIFLVSERRILREDTLSDYISKFIAQKEQQFENNVAPMEGNSMMAESFSWVDGDKDRQEGNNFSSRFVPVDYTQHFDSIEEAAASGKEANEKDMNDAFDRMRLQREAEIAAQASIKRG